MSRAVNYLFTLNNYTNEEIEKIKSTECKYMVFGKEIGASGTPHLQGFISFINARTMVGVHRINGWKRTALKKSEKPLSAIDYCKKGEQSHDEWEKKGVKGANYGKNADIFEIGEYAQGKRTDLIQLKDEILHGKKVDDILLENPFIYHQYGRTLEKIEDLAMRKVFRTEPTKGIWYYGKTGVGKSKKAFENFHPDTHYVVSKEDGWWDAYTQQETVIINDFRGHIPYDVLLEMVDGWAYSVKRRNRQPMPFTSKTLIITSSLSPEEVYCRRHEKDEIEQLVRRFEVIELK